MAPYWTQQRFAYPIIGGQRPDEDCCQINSPFNHQVVVGRCYLTSPEHAKQAMDIAQGATLMWRQTPAEDRAGTLEKFAELLEHNCYDLIALACLEGGKTISDAADEIREAVDFARYYAMQARALFSTGQTMPGPTGEENKLYLKGRGIFACISPWNFPLAIFVGQITAALAAGNCVVAKPAALTPLIAFRAVELLHEAGIPPDVLHLLPGSGCALGKILCADPRLAGIAFTGSTASARNIFQQLAQGNGPIIPFIAETGGQNAMIVDSSAQHEQVVNDVLRSAFNSAGQRCSALRVLYLQENIAPKVLDMLKGAMDELVLGDPCLLSTDIGPVINAEAKRELQQYIQAMSDLERSLHSVRLDQKVVQKGHFVAPTLISIDNIQALKKEHFGPILHVITYPDDALDQVLADVQHCGFGLTFGIHTRNEVQAEAIAHKLNIGNIYINRNMIGATVGVQPFGGQGLSGTGPKAGGPHYLYRFATELTISNNISAIGGNTSLLSEP